MAPRITAARPRGRPPKQPTTTRAAAARSKVLKLTAAQPRSLRPRKERPNYTEDELNAMDELSWDLSQGSEQRLEHDDQARLDMEPMLADEKIDDGKLPRDDQMTERDDLAANIEREKMSENIGGKRVAFKTEESDLDLVTEYHGEKIPENGSQLDVPAVKSEQAVSFENGLIATVEEQTTGENLGSDDVENQRLVQENIQLRELLQEIQRPPPANINFYLCTVM